MGRPSPIQLPRVLVATDGRDSPPQAAPPASALLLRDTNLAAVVQRAAECADDCTVFSGPLLAIDIDSVEGLDGDYTAAEFVTARLGIRIVLTRRPALAARVAELGCLGLLHVFAFDSTGLSRSLESHPRIPGVGTVISPGLVLTHFLPAELARLPRPILAYGLVGSAEDAWTCLRLADGVVVRPETAAAMSGSPRPAGHERPGRAAPGEAGQDQA